MGSFDDNLITLVTFLPLATGLVLVATSLIATIVGFKGLPAPVWRLAALVSTAFTFLISLQLFVTFLQIDVDHRLVSEVERNRAVNLFQCEQGEGSLNALGGGAPAEGVNDGVE